MGTVITWRPGSRPSPLANAKESIVVSGVVILQADMNESLDHGEVRNIDIEMFETLDEANVEAEKVWDHMPV